MADDRVIEAMAEAIWLAEPERIGSRRRSRWDEESEDTHNRYRPLARAALAAGLAKVEADRAALIKALEYALRAPMSARATIENALALVRRGV